MNTTESRFYRHDRRGALRFFYRVKSHAPGIQALTAVSALILSTMTFAILALNARNTSRSLHLAEEQFHEAQWNTSVSRKLEYQRMLAEDDASTPVLVVMLTPAGVPKDVIWLQNTGRGTATTATVSSIDGDWKMTVPQFEPKSTWAVGLPASAGPGSQYAVSYTSAKGTRYFFDVRLDDKTGEARRVTKTWMIRNYNFLIGEPDEPEPALYE